MSGHDDGGTTAHGDPDGALELYLQLLNARLDPDRFTAVIRAAQDTCRLLADGHPALLSTPGEALPDAVLHGEYLSLLAVMITGRLDHRVVQRPLPDGRMGFAVLCCDDPPPSLTPPEGVGSEYHSRRRAG
ncbi:hypothetical protein [Streptomyces sp. NPDC012888]|uniref:hypothetical protein n=1 Tax=Streptomyces sp. NPDC012888 TaxID=3364855 RepID=UPI0036CCD55F